jgi:AAA+ superfamily predicted ATPase
MSRDVEIRFGRSSSQSYPKAVAAAKRFPSFTEATDERPYSSVRVEATEYATLGTRLQRLWDMVAGWKSAEYLVDGAAADPRDMHRLKKYVECAAKKSIAPKPDGYCGTTHWGGGGWGCKFLSAIEREPSAHYRAYGSRTSGWWDFGAFTSGDVFAIDKGRLSQALRSDTERESVTFCPEFDFERVQRVVDGLPDEIVLSASDSWEIVYEEFTEGAQLSRRPTGIQHAKSSQDYGISIDIGAILGKNGGESTTNVSEERTVPQVTFADIGGIEDIVQTVREVIELPMRQPRLFEYMGISPHRGILLYGAPGCGKTLLAKAIANEVQAHFLPVSANELMSKWVGQSEERLRGLFETAAKLQPAIIFFDEIDAIGRSRSDSETARYQDDFLNQLLALMDGISDRGQVTVIGSTNRLELLDEALLRPGRFDYAIEVKKPTVQGCLKILSIATKNSPLADDVSIQELSEKLLGLSGADIAFVAREAAYNCLRRSLDLQALVLEDAQEPQLDELRVCASDFDAAIASARRCETPGP